MQQRMVLLKRLYGELVKQFNAIQAGDTSDLLMKS